MRRGPELEKWLDGPLAREQCRRRRQERREFLWDLVAALVGLALLCLSLWLVAPLVIPK